MPRDTVKMHQDNEGTSAAHGGQQVTVGWRSRLREDPGYRQKVWRSVWLCLSFCSLGMQTGQTGPAFLDLQIITNTNVQQASAFLSADAAGSITGALLAGPVYDLVSKSLLMLVSLVMLAVTVAVKPFCANFWLMVAISLVTGVFRGSIGSVWSADMIRTWGEGEGQSAMQALHFCFSLGALLSPLLTEPFLAPAVHALGYTRNGTEEASMQSHPNVTTVISSALTNVSRQTASTPVTPADSPVTETRVHFAFLIVAAVTFLSAVPLAVDFVRRTKRRRGTQSGSENPAPSNGRRKQQKEQDDRSRPNSLRSRVNGDPAGSNVDVPATKGTTPRRRDAEKQDDVTGTDQADISRRPSLPLVPYLAALTSMCLFYMLQMGTELVFISLLSNYVVVQMTWSKTQGAMVTFVFWICGTGSRLTSVFLVRALGSLRLLLACLVLLAAAFLAFVLASLWQLDWLVWVCSGAVGVTISPMFPTGVTWMKEELLPVTGRVTSAIIVAGCFGALINPLILGHLMENEGAIWMSYLMLGQATVQLMIFVLLYLFLRFYLRRRFAGTWRTTETIIISDAAATELPPQPLQPLLNNKTSVI